MVRALLAPGTDFTPVCTTEFGATAKLEPEWRLRGVKVIGLSVDIVEDHARWIADINETQHARVNFPILADKDRRVSMLFGMLDPTTFRHGASLGETMTVRSVFIISPSKRVELIISYPAHIGRSFDEILRVLDAPATLREASRGDARELAARGGHGGAALHLGREGRAPVRRAGRLPQGAFLSALCTGSVASTPARVLPPLPRPQIRPD